jgi:divalent metal cation (Fe/Co/Zn/Cd) transporter
MSIGHLVAGVALFAVGLNLAVESAMGLILRERPTIGTVQVVGHTVWLGWLMIGAMVLVVVGPFIYGPAKLRLSSVLHNKLLYADADMARADWTTNVASIVGVLGVGVGLWWLDGVAAVFISIGIVKDGVSNTRYAVRDLLDERARTQDDKAPHPAIELVLTAMKARPWAAEAGVRMRDQGQVVDVEVFFVPKRRRPPRTGVLEQTARDLAALDWQLQDVVIIPVTRIPDEATTRPAGG